MTLVRSRVFFGGQSFAPLKLSQTVFETGNKNKGRFFEHSSVSAAACFKNA